MKKVKLKLELQYNSPVILTFFLLSLLVLFLDQWTDGWTTMHLFCVYRSSLKDPLFYIRLFGHVLGHGSWDHFLNNMLLLLVIGPPMEEKYGSIPLLRGILLTALISGILQCALFPHSALLGTFSKVKHPFLSFPEMKIVFSGIICYIRPEIFHFCHIVRALCTICLFIICLQHAL